MNKHFYYDLKAYGIQDRFTTPSLIVLLTDYECKIKIYSNPLQMPTGKNLTAPEPFEILSSTVNLWHAIIACTEIQSRLLDIEVDTDADPTRNTTRIYYGLRLTK